MFAEQLNAISRRLEQLKHELMIEKKHFNFLTIYHFFEHFFDLQLKIAEYFIENKQCGSAFVILSQLNKLNPNHQRAKHLLQNLKPPFTNERKGIDEANSTVRSVLDLYRLGIDGMVDISEYFLEHNQLCQAKLLLTYVCRLSSNHDRAKKHLAIISSKSDDSMLRHDLVSEQYQLSLNMLRREHQKISQNNILEQLLWLEKLFTFINTNYQWKEGEYTFIEARYFKKSEEGRKQRSHLADLLYYQDVLKHKKIICTPLNEMDLENFDDKSLFVLKNVACDIYFDDLMYCLRMVFETIHQMPREFRIKYSAKLPWGESSWFYLEFLGALFFTNEESFLKFNILFTFGDIDSREYETQLCNFHQSISGYVCLVKIVVLELMKSDLNVLHHFFKEIYQQESNANPNPDAVKQTLPLNTLTVALDYFRKSFNLFRLTGLLPHKPDPYLMKYPLNQTLKVDSQITPYSLFQITNRPPTKGGLKGHYSFLRRVMLIGEMFTNRSWGSDVRSLKFVSPKVLSDIRNGLCHLEQMQSDALVDELEKETTIKMLHQEFVRLRNHLLHFIAERQGRFAPFISITETSVFTEWSAEGKVYWDSVKQVYAEDHASFNDHEFIPNEPLLDSININHVFNSLKYDTPEEISYRQNVRCQLEGKAPFNIDRIEDFLNNKSREPRWVKTVKKFVDQAKKKYTQLRLAEVEKVSAENEQIEKEVGQKQKDAMSNYPSIVSWSDKLCKELEKKDPVVAIPKQQQVIALIQRLRKRINKLHILLSESELRFNTTIPLYQQLSMVEKFKTLINNDIDLLFACSYLSAQIIAMVNELSAYREIKSPIAIERLKEWVALRNGLMHSDGIIESEEMSFCIIHFHKLPNTMCYFILEFLATCNEPFMTMDLASLPVDYAQPNPIKQDKPVDWSSFSAMFKQLMEQRPNSLPMVNSDEIEPIEPLQYK